MKRLFSLSYLTLECGPVETVEHAAAAGYDLAGLRMMPAVDGGRAFPLFAEPGLLAETIARSRDTGVGILDVEIARIDGRNSVADWLPMLEAAARVGARTVIAAGDDPQRSRMTDTFAGLCAAAARFGLTVNLEFTPWTALCDARMALDVVEASGADNAEVLIDTIHVARSATTLADLRAIPASRMSYLQICDAPAGIPASREELLYTARQERLLPGEGGVDIEEQVAALPTGLIVSVEIPSHARVASLGAREWARRTLDVSRDAMTRFDAARQQPTRRPA
jgi:sugar phosphate isomerase/epimerase